MDTKKIVWVYVICFISIAFGIFGIFELCDMFGVKSISVGSPVTIETKNDYNEILKVDYGLIDFDSLDNVTYKNIFIYDHVDFDGTKKKYNMLFNDTPFQNLKLSAGKIMGDLSKNFYDENGNVLCSAIMNFSIEFFSSQTKITCLMVNKNNCVSYMQAYMNDKGAVLKIVSKK